MIYSLDFFLIAVFLNIAYIEQTTPVLLGKAIEIFNLNNK